MTKLIQFNTLFYSLQLYFSTIIYIFLSDIKKEQEAALCRG